MKHDERQSQVELQEKNREWWDARPMAYDWHGTISDPEDSPAFFDKIDRRFFGSSPFYRGARPFQELIPFADLNGKRVLEIGCGLGAHAQLFCEAGSVLTAIDLTSRAVKLTKRRLQLRALKADVRVMDAENMEFEDDSFDFVWSWGVIHHSANTERILKEVYRILKAPGEFRCMVYHRRSAAALMAVLKGTLTGKLLRGMSISEVLSYYSDGAIARHYTPSEFAKMLAAQGFAISNTRILGQRAEFIPLPGSGWMGHLKSKVADQVPEGLLRGILGKVGSFLFVVARKDSVDPG